MKYERFEDLPVWQAAMDLALRIDQLTQDVSFRGRGDLCSQMRRAALSVSNNVAEGFERGTTAELLMFIYIARGSAGETRSMLVFCDRAAWAEHLKSEIANLKSLAESCSRQLRAWADSLQNSGIKGQRHLNDHSAAAFRAATSADTFWTKLQQVRAGAGVEEVFGTPAKQT